MEICGGAVAVSISGCLSRFVLSNDTRAKTVVVSNDRTTAATFTLRIRRQPLSSDIPRNGFPSSTNRADQRSNETISQRVARDGEIPDEQIRRLFGDTELVDTISGTVYPDENKTLTKLDRTGDYLFDMQVGQNKCATIGTFETHRDTDRVVGPKTYFRILESGVNCSSPSGSA